MKKVLLVLGVMAAVVFPFANNLAAQQEAEEMKYSFGTVVKVSESEVTVLEYDYSKDQEVEVAYTVNADTQLDNLGSLQELAKDDNIEVYFKEVDGKKVASMLIKESMVEEGAEGEDPGMDGNVMMEEMPEPVGNMMMPEDGAQGEERG